MIRLETIQMVPVLMAKYFINLYFQRKPQFIVTVKQCFFSMKTAEPMYNMSLPQTL